MTGTCLLSNKTLVYCSAFNRQLIYTTTSFILLLPASYFLGDFHAVFLYPYLTSPGFCWSFVMSAVLGCLLLMLYPTISSLEVVNLNHVGLAKVIVSAISLLSFGVPTVPQDYLFWTALSLLAGMFAPKVVTSDADRCVLSNIRQTMQHVWLACPCILTSTFILRLVLSRKIYHLKWRAHWISWPWAYKFTNKVQNRAQYFNMSNLMEIVTKSARF